MGFQMQSFAKTRRIPWREERDRQAMQTEKDDGGEILEYFPFSLTPSHSVVHFSYLVNRQSLVPAILGLNLKLKEQSSSV